MGKNATFQEKIQNNCEDNYRWKQTFQIDMAEMRKSNNYRYIFVLVDIYTLFLVATPLQNKSSSNVKAELEKRHRVERDGRIRDRIKAVLLFSVDRYPLLMAQSLDLMEYL